MELFSNIWPEKKGDLVVPEATYHGILEEFGGMYREYVGHSGDTSNIEDALERVQAATRYLVTRDILHKMGLLGNVITVESAINQEQRPT